MNAIREKLETQSDDRSRNELYEEYVLCLEKAAKVKEYVAEFDGFLYIKREVEEIVAIPTKKVKNELALAIDVVIKIRDEISDMANLLIGKWNDEVNPYSDFALGLIIIEKFKENAGKLEDLKAAVKEATDIAKKGKKIIEKMEGLYCDEKEKNQIKSDIDWIDNQRKELGEVVGPLAGWINRNLNTMRQ